MLRKTLFLVFPFTRVQSASMRPQRNAAENHGNRGRNQPGMVASMRPQRNAAENESGRENRAPGQRASMRPQRNAAENC